MMETVLNNYEALFGLCALIFAAGGIYAFVKSLPKMIKKSINGMDMKIDKLDHRMDSSDKNFQSMQVTQARYDEKINNIQTNQSEMRKNVTEIYKLLNKPNKRG